jgi:type IV pilus assembly protein PilB
VGTKQGAFLVTGPTGSGKSTTLYSLLKELNKVEVNIISVEDPVEMEISGTTQVEVNDKVGMTFASALKSALRQDPNVIMIGEIRDAESAKIAFDAATTGHLVISTLHTNDSLGVIPRLLELGVSKSTLASSLLGASAQRLARAICNKCREMRPITPGELDAIQSYLKLPNPPSELACGKGCEHCNHTGYHDRLPIIEIWHKSSAVQDMILKDANLENIETLLASEGFENLRQFAMKMVLSGLTTLEEVTRIVGGVQSSEHHAHAAPPDLKKAV